jgi:Glycosyltransferases involved in cell wall biogenesis
MPTRGRQKWANMALRCFFAQTYRNKELIVLDDADDPSFPQGEGLIWASNLIYAVAETRWSVGKKRNTLARMANGTILCHFDSDDWSAPERVAQQVDFLKQSRKSVVGFNTLLFADCTDKAAWRYELKNFGLGTSLCYTKAWWSKNQFPDMHSGEDREFNSMAQKRQQIAVQEGGKLMVARMHPGNTSKKEPVKHPHVYQPFPWEELPGEFLALE